MEAFGKKSVQAISALQYGAGKERVSGTGSCTPFLLLD
jgi:hypothetical protein